MRERERGKRCAGRRYRLFFVNDELPYIAKAYVECIECGQHWSHAWRIGMHGGTTPRSTESPEQERSQGVSYVHPSALEEGHGAGGDGGSAPEGESE